MYLLIHVYSLFCFVSQFVSILFGLLKIYDAHFSQNMQIIYEWRHRLKHNFMFFFEDFTLKFSSLTKIGFDTNF